MNYFLSFWWCLVVKTVYGQNMEAVIEGFKVCPNEGILKLKEKNPSLQGLGFV